MIPELLADVTIGVDEDVSHVAARILVADDDEVPGVTPICDSKRVREFHGGTQGITEDDERLTWLERRAYYRKVGAWSAPSVRIIRGVFPDRTCMMYPCMNPPCTNGHSFVSLLCSSKRTH